MITVKTVTVLLTVTIVAVSSSKSNKKPNDHELEYVDKFKCTKESPYNKVVYSKDTKPPVSLTHIFCGQIKGQRKKAAAQGYHSTYLTKIWKIDDQPANIIGETRVSECGNRKKCPYFTDGVKVRLKNGKYLKKDLKNRQANYNADVLSPTTGATYLL